MDTDGKIPGEQPKLEVIVEYGLLLHQSFPRQERNYADNEL